MESLLAEGTGIHPTGTNLGARQVCSAPEPDQDFSPESGLSANGQPRSGHSNIAQKAMALLALAVALLCLPRCPVCPVASGPD